MSEKIREIIDYVEMLYKEFYITSDIRDDLKGMVLKLESELEKSAKNKDLICSMCPVLDEQKKADKAINQ